MNENFKDAFEKVAGVASSIGKAMHKLHKSRAGKYLGGGPNRVKEVAHGLEDLGKRVVKNKSLKKGLSDFKKNKL